MVRFTSAATHDHNFFKELNLKKGSFIVFDKGYVDYMQYYKWTLENVYFVTGQKENAHYTSFEEFDIDFKEFDIDFKEFENRFPDIGPNYKIPIT